VDYSWIWFRQEIDIEIQSLLQFATAQAYQTGLVIPCLIFHSRLVWFIFLQLLFAIPPKEQHVRRGTMLSLLDSVFFSEYFVLHSAVPGTPKAE
jgi:hypothetical protein